MISTRSYELFTNHMWRNIVKGITPSIDSKVIYALRTCAKKMDYLETGEKHGAHNDWEHVQSATKALIRLSEIKPVKKSKKNTHADRMVKAAKKALEFTKYHCGASTLANSLEAAAVLLEIGMLINHKKMIEAAKIAYNAETDVGELIPVSVWNDLFKHW